MDQPQDHQDPGSEEPKDSKIKVGDKEYTSEEIAAEIAAKEELEGKYKDMQSGFTKSQQELKEYKEELGKADDIRSGALSADDMSEQEKIDMLYVQKLAKKSGFITNDEYKDVVSTLEALKSDRDKELEVKGEQAKKELLERIEKEITDLSTQFEFVKPDELKKYMDDEALQKRIHTPKQAARDLYFDQFVNQGVKPENLPSLQGNPKGRIEEPKAKLPELGSRAQHESIMERYKSIVN